MSTLPSAPRRARPWPVFRALTVLVLVLGCLAAAGPARAGCGTACPGVGTTTGGYVGSLLLPPGSRVEPVSLRTDAATCAGCVWTLEPACQRPDLTNAMCAGAAFSCRPGSIRLSLWLQRPGDPTATHVGSFCFDPAVPLQPVALLPGVRDRFLRLVPALRPSAEPPGGGLVNLPVVFAAGQPGSLGRPRFDLAGRVVDLEATAAWSWEFADGGVLATRRAGGPWPDVSVAHAYPAGGRYAVRVTSTWTGSFWVDGAGPFQVTGAPVTQTAVLPVVVRTAAAVLVATPP